MAHGRLSVGSIATVNTATNVYTAPNNCVSVECDVVIANGQNAGTVKVAVSTTDTPAESEYVEQGTELAINGVLTLSNLTLSPGERIIVQSTSTGASVRVFGSEKTKA